MVSPIKLFVATPCYGGMLCKEYLQGILQLQKECLAQGIFIEVMTMGNESLITRARNILVSFFLDSPEQFTHMLFIDADMGFKERNVFRLLEKDENVCCGIYPKKDINWEEVLRLSRQEGMTSSRLQAESLMYNINFADHSHITVNDGFVETLDGATGFMLLKREVFTKMKEAYPELAYTSDHWLNSKKYESNNTYLFFDCMKDPESGRYLAEDYTFCRRWRAAGGKIYSDINMHLTHFGNYPFKGHIGAKFKLKSHPPDETINVRK